MKQSKLFKVYPACCVVDGRAHARALSGCVRLTTVELFIYFIAFPALQDDVCLNS